MTILPDNHQSSQPMGSRWVAVLTSLLIIVLTFLAFRPVLDSGFVDWDDKQHLLDYRWIRSLSFFNLVQIFRDVVNGTYIPLTMLSFACEYSVFGPDPRIFHLTNLVFHLLVTLLVLIFGLQVGLSLRAAGLAALLFGIHPMHVESVAWITERKDVLYSTFYLLALCLYWRYLKFCHMADYLGALICGMLSLLAKPMALSLPLILWVCDVLAGRRFSWRIVGEKIPFFLFVVPVAWVTYIQHARIPINNWLEAPLLWCWTLAFYVQTFFLPFILLPVYSLPKPISFFNPTYAVSLVTIVFLVLMMIRHKTNRWVIFAGLYFFFSIFFLLRFDVGVDANIVADRFMYLPSLGVCFLVGFVLDTALQRFKNRVGFFCVIMVVVVLYGLLMMKTTQQCGIWKDSVALWSHMIRWWPDQPKYYMNRSSAYLEQSEFHLALMDINRAISLNPQHEKVYYNRGLIYEQVGEFDKAEANLYKELEYHPCDPQALIALGNLYGGHQNIELAFRHYDRALACDPHNAAAAMGRGVSLAQSGHYTEALADYDLALRIDPYRAEAYVNKGVTFLSMGRDDLALESFNRAERLDGRILEVYYNRGNLYRDQKQYEKAMADYQKVIDLKVDHVMTYYQRGMALIEMGRLMDALDDFHRILEIDPHHLYGRLQRAGVYDQLGRYDESLADYNVLLKENAGLGDVYLRRSLVYQQIGLKQAALQDALQARALGVDVPENHLQGLQSLGTSMPYGN
jgi:tetratricopeptide (TPR) repeat protein